jgi:hypothetical protein
VVSSLNNKIKGIASCKSNMHLRIIYVFQVIVQLK